MKKIWIVLSCFYLPMVYGHGMVHNQIDDLSAQIKSEPKNTELYLKRGRLYIDDENYRAANADFKLVLNIDQNTRSAHYYLGEIALKSRQYEEAIRYAEKFLLTLQNETDALVRAYRLLGAAYQGQKNYPQAAIYYQQAVNLAQEPLPEMFFDLVGVYKKYQRYPKALAAVEQGIQRLGPLAIFHKLGLEIELASGAYHQALQRIDGMIVQGQRLPFLYQQKARILIKVGRFDEAKQAFKSALVELGKLPAARRESKIMHTLRSELIAELEQ